MEKIFSDFGIEIYSQGQKHYIQYDAGEIVQKIVTIEVSKDDAEKAQKSSEDAYHVIIQYS